MHRYTHTHTSIHPYTQNNPIHAYNPHTYPLYIHTPVPPSIASHPSTHTPKTLPYTHVTTHPHPHTYPLYTHTPRHPFTCNPTHTHAPVHACTHIPIHHTHTPTPTHTPVHQYTPTHPRVCTIHLHTYRPIHPPTHTHMHRYLHTFVHPEHHIHPCTHAPTPTNLFTIHPCT